MSEKKRFLWIDSIKLIAIVSVVTYHLLSGLVGAGIMAQTDGVSYALQVFSGFQVFLFFICSGFLYQELTKKQNAHGYGRMLLKKLLSLGVPYVAFTGAVFLLKIIFKDSVNFGFEHGFFKTLALGSVSPYWFLQVLFFCFLLSPVIKSKADGTIRLCISAGLYILAQFITGQSVFGELTEYAVRFMNCFFWFVLGMSLSYFRAQKLFTKTAALLLLAFFGLEYIRVFRSVDFICFNIILSLLSCAGIVLFVGKICQKKEGVKALTFLSLEILPIFLMHTIFAAGARIILVHLGVTNAVVHIILGFIASICLPIAADLVLKKLRLDIFYYPTKYFKIK